MGSNRTCKGSELVGVFGKGKGGIYRMLEQHGSGMQIQACSFVSTSAHKKSLPRE